MDDGGGLVSSAYTGVNKRDYGFFDECMLCVRHYSLCLCVRVCYSVRREESHKSVLLVEPEGCGSPCQGQESRRRIPALTSAINHVMVGRRIFVSRLNNR